MEDQKIMKKLQLNQSKLIVWEALYNWMTYESSTETLSIHRTKAGAERAVELSKAQSKKEHEELYDDEWHKERLEYCKKEGITDKKDIDAICYVTEWPRQWEWWGIRETEVLP